jgi:hypothetical protein
MDRLPLCRAPTAANQSLNTERYRFWKFWWLVKHVALKQYFNTVQAQHGPFNLQVKRELTGTARQIMTKKFLVTYHIPTHVMESWAKVDAEERKRQENELMQEWTAWMAKHASMVVSTEAAGKTKLASTGGITDTRNDIVVCSIVQAETHEQAAQIFDKHPHLKIPEATIQIMQINPMH